MAVINKHRMVVTVFRVIFIVMAIVLVLLWFLGGGVNKIIGDAGSLRFTSIADLLSASNTAAFATFRLPWQSDMPQLSVPGVSDQSGSGSVSSGSAASHASVSTGSPYAGLVTLSEMSARSQTANSQYIEISASLSLSNPIDISGWILESPLTGNHAYIPQAAHLFEQGHINAVGDVLLVAGANAIVSTGLSPVGVSFEENRCTGYLGTLQPFIPALLQQCPLPLESIQNTDGNQASLGANCLMYLQSLPACTFPANPPAGLSSACIGKMQSALSYNGCLAAHQNSASFFRPSWRLYLALTTSLWGGEHDVIRLLDAQGKVVDVINY